MPKRNVIHERARFHRHSYQSAFVRSLYSMSLQNLEFGASKDEQICDRLVIGIADGEVYQKLQLEPELTLEKAIQMLASLSR